MRRHQVVEETADILLSELLPYEHFNLNKPSNKSCSQNALKLHKKKEKMRRYQEAMR